MRLWARIPIEPVVAEDRIAPSRAGSIMTAQEFHDGRHHGRIGAVRAADRPVRSLARPSLGRIPMPNGQTTATLDEQRATHEEPE